GEAVRAGLAVPDGGQTDTIEYTDRKSGVYKKLVIKNDVISGAILFGDTAGASRFFQMMQDEVNISAERHSILFGNPNLGNAGHSGLSEVSMMSPSTIVCGCNGVTKKTITDAIVEKRLTTLRDITKCTKAAGSCGGCAPIVEEILVSVLGAPFTSPAKAKPLCDCTELTHEDVKKEIRTSRLTTVGTAMRVMGWETEGCETCRPAVNYYIQTAWPAQAVDDPFSRVENERLCANIQEDSTYSVIPRMYGGLTTPDELMKIAGAAKKYNVPAVKITGGQRIALVGVKKEDLPEVWGQLDMPSGYAYGKALRTVKTCVGRRWCRFGTQDSLSLGITIEKTLERIWTPAKVKLSVSGCPRNCAESSIKDLGIVGIEGAWEIYCGGNGGVKVRTADLLAAVSEKEEVMEIVKAYLQLYREDARYGERTSSWIKRVGLQGIKKAVIEDLKSRRLLAGRMDEYLSTLREDPWEGLLKRPSTPAPL
ncbi:MAG: NAD(P)/FAD-dependent oxidoreductase, partial [Deltaproteobacteria bacterium]|nr:NAD(P)/FAD-dependent oxidoreductase [Deltaproteobacteria bacterium]